MQMKYKMKLGLAGIVLCMSPMVQAQTNTLSDLDGLVGKWINLRSSIADEQREWDVRKARWEEELQLLKQESDTLDRQLKTFSDDGSKEDSERSELLSKKERMNANLNSFGDVLSRSEKTLIQWKAVIPESLRLPMDGLFDLLPATEKAAEKLERTKRVQTVIALCTQIETLQHEFHTTREVLEIESGGRRQVDVLYVGLSCAFAVSSDNDWAAVGVPGTPAWKWAVRPEIAKEVRNAIDILNRQKAAELIHLPLQLSGGADE